METANVPELLARIKKLENRVMHLEQFAAGQALGTDEVVTVEDAAGGRRIFRREDLERIAGGENGEAVLTVTLGSDGSELSEQH